jgi:hypothetical protein
MRVRDGKWYGTKSVSDLSVDHVVTDLCDYMIDTQVADAPRTVPEIAPLSRTRNRKPIWRGIFERQL